MRIDAAGGELDEFATYHHGPLFVNGDDSNQSNGPRTDLDRRNLLPERLFGAVLQGSSETVRQAPRERRG